MTKKSILIVCYTFPPSSGIGGKRWYNLGKELSKLCMVDVLTFSKSSNKEQHFNNVHVIDSFFPEILNRIPKTIFEKLEYRIKLFKRRLFLKGTPFDKASGERKRFHQKISDLQKVNNYDVIITSGAPFSLLYYSLKEKNNSLFKNVSFFSDLRDPWTWGASYGINSISSRKKNYEIYKERFVIENSDYILVPSEQMKTHLNSAYANTKVATLPHGFDKNRIDSALKGISSNINQTNLQLIYGGTWYSDIDDSYTKFIQCLDQTRDNYLFEIFSQSHSEIPIPKGANIKTQSYINEEKLFRKIKNADLYVVFFPERVKNFISAKFFEIFYIGTPILLISPKGKLSEFILQNSLGFHIETEKITKEKVNDVIEQILPFNEELNRTNLLSFNFKNLAEDLIKIINTQ